MRRINVDLAGPDGNGDGATDAVTVTGTARKDHVLVSGSDGSVSVNGVRPRVRISHAEPADQLTVDTREGDDIVNSRRLAPGTIGLTIV